MSDFSVVFARSARKELEALDRGVALRILARIESLARVPLPSGCRKLAGSRNLWRIRAGDYRILYAINDRAKLVDVIAVRHRSDAYR